LSEVLNEKVTSGEENGFSRRRVMAGVAWSVPVILTTVAAPPASASPGPTPAPTVTPASGSFVTGTQTITSTTSSSHHRVGATVPATLRLKDLGGVTGDIRVMLTIQPLPVAPKAPLVSLSTVGVGSFPVVVTPSTTGNTFKAEFSYRLPVGAPTLDFSLSGYSYRGNNQDSATYAVTTLITFQERGATSQLTPGSGITL
jgi:hypothetical protein